MQHDPAGLGELSGQGAVAALVARMEGRLHDVATSLTDAFQRQIPVYSDVPTDSVRVNTERVLHLIADLMRQPEPDLRPSASFRALIREWAEQDIPLELIAHSLHLGARELMSLVERESADLELEPRTIDRMQAVAWEWALNHAAAINALQRDRADRSELAGASARAQAVKELLAAGASGGDLLETARALGLAPHGRYHVRCARGVGVEQDIAVLRSWRTGGGRADQPVVDAVVDGLLVAIIAQEPRLVRASDATVGVGGVVGIGELHRSYAEAREALAVATSLDVSGSTDLATLGPRVLLATRGVSWQSLREHHLAGLDALGDQGGDLVRTVRSYLARDRKVDATSADLHLHRNSVRQRLRRFTEVTGLDLDDTEDLVLTWWLLHS